MIPVDLIKVAPCDSSRRALCLHRHKIATSFGFQDSCTSPDNVLRGCPMMQQASGCFHEEPCQDFLKADTITKDGQKFMKPATCEHHPDRFQVNKPRAGKKKTAIPAAQAVPAAWPPPAPAPLFDEGTELN